MKLLVSKQKSYGTKNSSNCFMGYNEGDGIKPLCIKLPQMTGYVNCFDSNKTMSFKDFDNTLLKNCYKIWQKVRSLMNIRFSG